MAAWKSSINGLTIKKLLLLAAAAMLLVSAVFAVLIYNGLTVYERAIDREAASSQILTDIYQRRLIADDYILNPSDRAKSQWLIEQGQTVSLVEARTFAGPSLKVFAPGRRFPAGTRAPSNSMSACQTERTLPLPSITRALNPGLPRSTRKPLTW